MSIMNTVTWKSMQKNKNRTIVTLIAIVLATAVFTSILTMAASTLDFLIRNEKTSAGGYYTRFSYLDAEKAEAIRQDERIKNASSFHVHGFVKLEDEESNWSSFILAGIDDTFSSMMPLTLIEGRMPQNSRELLLPEQATEVFSYYGLPHTIGESVNLDEISHYSELASVLGETEQAVCSQNYTIVGIYKDTIFDEVLVLQSLLTHFDGSDQTLYQNIFATTKRPTDAYELTKQFPDFARVHTRLLSYYGATAYVNYNTVIWLIAAALILIVMIAAISVIHHAFSVSVSERTKDFGLLCSIGATKKQIRESVMFEAGVLSCFGLPIGFLLGFAMDALLFSAIGKRLANLIVSTIGEESAVGLHAVLSPIVILSVLLVTIITVILSVWIPAMRASRAIPMEAIRQTSIYTPAKKRAAPVPSCSPTVAAHATAHGKTAMSIQANSHGTKKEKKISRMILHVLGVTGMMAEKYHCVSRKRFRPIVLSMTLSIILLMTASSLGNMVETVVASSIHMENHDFRLYQLSEAQIQALRDSGLMTHSAWISENENLYAYAPDESFSQEFREAFSNIREYDPDQALNIQHAKLVYVEDAVLEAYLIEHGIDPTPYMDSENPMALLCDMRLLTPYFKNENGDWIHYSYQLMPFDKKTESVLFLSYIVPTEIQSKYMKSDESWMWGYVTENDKLLAQMIPNTTSIVNGVVQMGDFDESRAIYLEVILDKSADGTPCVSYYEYDKASGIRNTTPICVLESEDLVREYHIGAHIAERPFGVGEPVSGKIELILPLSAKESSSYLAVNTNQYLMFKSYLDEMGIRYTDNCEQEENARTVRMLLNVFSYGFVSLISVLTLAGALNTISASIMMRHRDFGMLCSLGFEKKKIYAILILENIFHGAQAVLIGIPIGLLIHVVIYLVQKEAVVTAFTLPWEALLLSVGSVLVITLSGIFCALRNLRRTNLIDLLKNEIV